MIRTIGRLIRFAMWGLPSFLSITGTSKVPMRPSFWSDLYRAQVYLGGMDAVIHGDIDGKFSVPRHRSTSKSANWVLWATPSMANLWPAARRPLGAKVPTERPRLPRLF